MFVFVLFYYSLCPTNNLSVCNHSSFVFRHDEIYTGISLALIFILLRQKALSNERLNGPRMSVSSLSQPTDLRRYYFCTARLLNKK